MGQCLVNLILKNGTYQKELFFGSSMQKKNHSKIAWMGAFLWVLKYINLYKIWKIDENIGIAVEDGKCSSLLIITR